MALTHKRKQLATVATAVAVAGLLTSAMALRTSSAAFTASTSGANNVFTSAKITLTGSQTGTAPLFTTADGTMDGGVDVTRCVTVTLSSTLAATNTRNVRLYVTNIAPAPSSTAVTAGALGDLAPYLTVKVESANLPAGTTVAADCTTTGTPGYATLTSGLLSAATYLSPTTGLRGWEGASSSAGAVSKVYKITTTVTDVAAAQGLTTSADLVWTATNAAAAN